MSSEPQSIRDLYGVKNPGALAIARTGVSAVVIKGGHLPGDPVDTLLWEGEFHHFPGERGE